MNSIAESWERIETWLAANAPKILGNLNPPATDRELADAEKAFGCELPAQWRELYRRHNGLNFDSNQGNLFYGMGFLSLEDAVAQLELNGEPGTAASPVRAADVGVRKDDMFNPKWIAFGHDWGETLLRIDLDPAPEGTVGQVIFTDYADDTVILLNPSLTSFMADFVRDLEDGRYFLDQEAREEGNHFLDCDAEMDLINWAHSPRWKHLGY